MFRFLPTFEPLAERVLPAITATFWPGVGVLTVFGDAQDNTITVEKEKKRKRKEKKRGQVRISSGHHLARWSANHGLQPRDRPRRSAHANHPSWAIDQAEANRVIEILHDLRQSGFRLPSQTQDATRTDFQVFRCRPAARPAD
jgi:hypothetical protein